MGTAFSLHACVQATAGKVKSLLLIRWMSNEHVYQSLNEHQQITAQLKNI